MLELRKNLEVSLTRILTENMMSTLLNEKLEFINVPFSTIRNEDRAKQMGLIILETDLTIETEFRKFLSQDENDKKKVN